MKVTISTILLTTFCSIVFAQRNNVQYEELSKDSIVWFLRYDTDSSKIELSSSASLLRDILPFSQADEMKLQRVKKDNIGYEHHYFRQLYNGIPVEHGRYSVHGKNGYIEYITGKFRKIGNITTTAVISEEQALKVALGIVGATQYKWEIEEEEKFLKTMTNNPDTSFFPKGELVICQNYLSQHDSSYRLAYKFDIYSQKPLSRKVYYIDAINGELLLANEKIKNINVTGTVATRYSGSRTVTTDSFSGGYRLRETRNGTAIQTYNMNWGANYSTASDYIDNDNNWTSAEYNNSTKDNAGLDAHWAAERTYDYFYAKFSRNSLDGSGRGMFGYVNALLSSSEPLENRE